MICNASKCKPSSGMLRRFSDEEEEEEKEEKEELVVSDLEM